MHPPAAVVRLDCAHTAAAACSTPSAPNTETQASKRSRRKSLRLANLNAAPLPSTASIDLAQENEQPAQAEGSGMGTQKAAQQKPAPSASRAAKVKKHAISNRPALTDRSQAGRSLTASYSANRQNATTQQHWPQNTASSADTLGEPAQPAHKPMKQKSELHLHGSKQQPQKSAASGQVAADSAKQSDGPGPSARLAAPDAQPQADTSSSITGGSARCVSGTVFWRWVVFDEHTNVHSQDRPSLQVLKAMSYCLQVQLGLHTAS